MNQLQPATCPFCRDEVQAAHFAASDHFLALYNLAPILPGHSLVVPRRHILSLMELGDPELCELTLFSRDIVKVLQKAFGSRSFDWTIQEGVEAGQTIPHLHLHLIPRTQGDLSQPGDWYPLMQQSEAEIIDSAARPRLSEHDMMSIVLKLRATAKEVLSV
jgi:bis(5'-adenosyl)-triphosphatase